MSDSAGACALCGPSHLLSLSPQNAMNLPPDKARLLRQYDNEKKWELICDQVRKVRGAFGRHLIGSTNRVSSAASLGLERDLADDKYLNSFKHSFLWPYAPLLVTTHRSLAKIMLFLPQSGISFPSDITVTPVPICPGRW